MLTFSVPLYVLKRRAKAHARAHGIPLHAGLDHIAQGEGFAAWSHLVQAAERTRPARTLLARLHNGDCVLLAARPGQGKTLLGLELLIEATAAGRGAWFFSLESTPAEVAGRLRALGVDPTAMQPGFQVDCSDAISAEYLVAQLAAAHAGTVVVLDYLQILDQPRRLPPLSEQLRTLSTFCRARGLVLVALSQVDRHYDHTRDGLPSVRHIRQPNPIDLSLFQSACFLHEGKLQHRAIHG
ncbi:MAG: DNA helicase [Pseudomonadota bacterium]